MYEHLTMMSSNRWQIGGANSRGQGMMLRGIDPGAAYTGLWHDKRGYVASGYIPKSILRLFPPPCKPWAPPCFRIQTIRNHSEGLCYALKIEVFALAHEAFSKAIMLSFPQEKIFLVFTRRFLSVQIVIWHKQRGCDELQSLISRFPWSE